MVKSFVPFVPFCKSIAGETVSPAFIRQPARRLALFTLLTYAANSREFFCPAAMNSHVSFRLADTDSGYFGVTGCAGVTSGFTDGVVWTFGGSIDHRYQGVGAIRAPMGNQRRGSRCLDRLDRRRFGSFCERDEAFGPFVRISRTGEKQACGANRGYGCEVIARFHVISFQFWMSVLMWL
jgi:hypothetical protein